LSANDEENVLVQERSGVLPKLLVLQETHLTTPSLSMMPNVALKLQTKNIGS
jgi:hypothetical protein